LIRACERLGVDAVVVYGQALADAGVVSIPDHMTGLFAEDYTNPEAVLGALLRAGLDRRHYAAVISANEYTMVLGALLATFLGCRGLPVDVAVRYRDKALQKRLVKAAGVPTADCQVIEDIQKYENLPELISSPMVLKPVAGVGTRLTTVVGSSDDLQAAARRIAATSDQRTFLLETFTDGDEVIVDGLVRGGELVFHSMGYYPEPCLSVVEQQAAMTYGRFDPVMDKDLFEEGAALAAQVIGALGMTDGVFHLEAFRPKDGGPLVFGECAARRGAAMIFEEILWKFNVDMAEEALRAALGWPPRLDVKVRPGAVGTTNLLAPPGVLFSCPSVADITSRPGAIYARIEFPLGATMRDRIPDAASRLGQVLVTVDEPGQLAARFAEIRDWFASQLVVAPAKVPNRVLRAWQRDTWPASMVGDEHSYEPEETCEEME
jgi:biotin carboxylase